METAIVLILFGCFCWGVSLVFSFLAWLFKAIDDFFGVKKKPLIYSGSSSWSSSSSRSSKPEKESPYTRDWSSVARKYKESRNWRCEECYVNLSGKSHKRLLHVHHQDNDPQNNSSWNLIALCVICHSERPGSGHKRLAGAIRTDGRKREVEYLR